MTDKPRSAEEITRDYFERHGLTDKPHTPTPDRIERALRALLDISDEDWPRYRDNTSIGQQCSLKWWRERVVAFLAVADEPHAELVAALEWYADRRNYFSLAAVNDRGHRARAVLAHRARAEAAQEQQQ